MIDIGVIPHLELVDNYRDVLDAHWAELGTLGRDPNIPRNENREMYLQAERDGLAFTIAVIDTEDPRKVVGYMQLFLNIHPHNVNEAVANCINVFLYKEYRNSGLGKKLLKAAEQEAKRLTATQISVCSNNLAPIDKFLESCGYRIYDVVYGKELEK